MATACTLGAYAIGRIAPIRLAAAEHRAFEPLRHRHQHRGGFHHRVAHHRGALAKDAAVPNPDRLKLEAHVLRAAQGSGNSTGK